MSNNVVSLGNKRMAKRFREIADAIENDASTKVAYAIFVDLGNDQMQIIGDGFHDGEAVARYFGSFMRTHGFGDDNDQGSN